MNNIKETSIKNYLAKQGIFPSKERIGYGMYNSPFRNECKPSFKVDYDKNVWFDFGMGEGGSIVDLIARLEQCSIGNAFKKLEDESELNPYIIQSQENLYLPGDTFMVEHVEELTNHYLLNYLQSRRVNLEIAKHYCKEVHYSNNGKNFYAIGFKNNSGGWELRNQFFQGTISPKSITTFENGTDVTLLFEGFIDMLSYLTIKKVVAPISNVCVLNSVYNFNKAKEFLKTQSMVHCFLDNDEAGHTATIQTKKECKEVLDHSNLYADYNDVNDYLQGKKMIQQKPKTGIKIRL